MSGETYTIRTLEDMARVPKDRAPFCIVELADCLYRASQAGLVLHEMQWTDDGQEKTTEAYFIHPDGHIETFKPEDFA